MKNKILVAIAVILLIAFATLGVVNVKNSNNKIELQQIELKDNSVKLKNLNEEYNKLLESKSVDQKKLEELQKQKDQLEKDLQAKLQREEARKVALQSASSFSTVAYAMPSEGAKAYIYSHESGNCPTKWQGEHQCTAFHGTPTDPNVGYGLCQATPGWKMASAGADWATSYETQDRWCTQYAQKYGGWEGSYLFWINNHWW